jgi:hypothetical protein
LSPELLPTSRRRRAKHTTDVVSARTSTSALTPPQCNIGSEGSADDPASSKAATRSGVVVSPRAASPGSGVLPSSEGRSGSHAPRQRREVTHLAREPRPHPVTPWRSGNSDGVAPSMLCRSHLVAPPPSSAASPCNSNAGAYYRCRCAKGCVLLLQAWVFCSISLFSLLCGKGILRLRIRIIAGD